MQDNDQLVSLLSHIVYINDTQYYTYLNSTTQFILIFELSKKNRKFLLRINQECIDNKNFHGIVFVINKNELLFDRLFFLKNISFRLFENSKKVGIWGLPNCIIQFIFDPYGFSQFVSKSIPQETEKYSKYTPTYQQNSSLLLKCTECFTVDICDGLGLRTENHLMWNYRSSHKYRKIGRDALFKTNNKNIEKIYHEFCTYIDNSDLMQADRYLYFVKNIDFGSSYSFSDRFVYHCDFPSFAEYEKELHFLSKYVENKNFLPQIDALAKKGKICRIGYSKADKDNVSRESFYVNPNDGHNYYLLDYFNIDIKIQFPNTFYGVGVDFYNGQIESYKIYFMVPVETLFKMHPQYFKKINIDIFSLHEKSHYYVIRMDADKKKISERIDLVYNKKDKLHYKQYFKQLSFSEDILNDLHIFAFAFEFKSMNLQKINIYYRNQF